MSRPIRRVVDLETVLIEDEETGRTRTVRLADLGVASEAGNPATTTHPDLAGISPAAWSVATARHKVIKPLLDPRKRTKKAIGAAARAARVDPSTIYRWIRRHDASGRVTSLVPSPPGPTPGGRRLSADVEGLIRATIEEMYLTPQRRRAQQVCEQILRRCRALPTCPSRISAP